MDKSTFTSKFSILIAGLALTLGTSACLARGTDFGQIYEVPGTFNQVDFATLESQVLAPKCLECHADFSTAQGIQPYITPGNPQQSALYTEITSGDMPPGGPALAAGSATIVAEYITGLSAPSTLIEPAPTEGAVPTPQPSSVSFDTLKTSILQPKCMQCHQDFGTQAGLQPYVTAGNPQKSSLYEASVSGSMPPSGPALTADELTMMKTFISGMTAE
jgi:hypothetical protein